MAVCALFLATDASLPLAKLSGQNVEIALIIFVIVHVLTHLVLTIHHMTVC